VEGNRWQALQGHLKAARAALQDGDRTRALAEVDVILAIDPEFVAAGALRDQILTTDGTRQSPAEPAPDVPTTATPPVLVSAEGYARFEQRTRQRRIDKRTAAAGAALAGGRFAEAAAAIEEIRELDPDAAGLPALVAAADEARRARGRRPASRPANQSKGPQLVAAGVFAAVMLAAPRSQPRLLLAHPMTFIATLVTDVQPAPPSLATGSAAAPATAEPTGATGTSGNADTTGIAAPSMPPPPYWPSSVETAPAPIVQPEPMVQPLPRPLQPDDEAPHALPPVPAGTPAATPVVPAATHEPPPAPPLREVARPIDSPAPIADDALIRQTLQRYRSAYERLDAQSARAVYPSVNERALARAFDDLESQHLTFDNCDVQVNGASAAAACRGTARYVPKVGSREPRTEPRVWNFTLRKDGSGWKIDTARAER
jgi:hypothetical protein